VVLSIRLALVVSVANVSKLHKLSVQLVVAIIKVMILLAHKYLALRQLVLAVLILYVQFQKKSLALLMVEHTKAMKLCVMV
jgi:hypothetical protein